MNMSTVIMNAARSRISRRQNHLPSSKHVIESENMGVDEGVHGKAKQFGASQRHASQDGYFFGESKRRILSDSGNLPQHDAQPTAPKKAKCTKVPLVSRVREEQAIPVKTGARPKRPTKAKAFKVPTPQRVLRYVEPMETGDLENAAHHMLVRMPPGVKDIDSRSNDPLLCPTYAQDIINYVQCVEQRWVLSSDHLESGEVTPYMRSILLDWLIQVQDHLSLQQETLHLCVALIDRFLSIKPVALARMQLLGVTCLFIASKFYERFSPEVATLVHLTDNTYTHEDVIQTELTVLGALRFDINVPSPVFFLDRLLLVEEEEHTQQIEHTARYLLDLTLINLKQVQFPSSVRASTALFIARILWDVSEPWSMSLAYYSKYSERDLAACYENMVVTLSKVQRSKMQGARSKYSSESRFANISNHPRLKCHEKLVR